LTPIPWALRVWAQPVMTGLAPAERYDQARGRQPKTLTERAQPMLFQVRRWLPKRPIVIVGDNTDAALDLLAAGQALPEPLTCITRLRMDAAWYQPAPPYAGRGRPRNKGKRLPTPQHDLQSPDTCWNRVELRWYDRQTRPMDLASGSAVWFH
jgi:hypothetical protein